MSVDKVVRLAVQAVDQAKGEAARANDMRIDIDMGKACTQCGAMGAGASGRCLDCIAVAVRDGLGRKGAQEFMGVVTGQLSLTTEWVDLTEGELMDRGRALAEAVRDLDLLDEEHKERKREMARARNLAASKIGAMAYVVRVGKEERPVGERA